MSYMTYLQLLLEDYSEMSYTILGNIAFCTFI